MLGKDLRHFLCIGYSLYSQHNPKSTAADLCPLIEPYCDCYAYHLAASVLPSVSEVFSSFPATLAVSSGFIAGNNNTSFMF